MLTDEPLEPGQWRRFVEPAAVLWLVAGAGAIRWGRLDLCQNLRDAAAGQVLENIAALALLTAAGVIVVDLLAWAVRQVWLGRAVPWPLSTLLLRRRRRRWHAAGHGIDPAADPEAVQRFARRRTRIALTEPQSPTWIGDRIMAASTRVRNAYGLDLPSAWPRLWLLLPDAGRAELRRAARLWHGSARWTAWAILYTLLAVGWWPLAILAAVTLASAIQAGRGATAVLTDLVESAADLHGPALAAALGCADSTGPDLTPETGRRINRVTRKGL